MSWIKMTIPRSQINPGGPLWDLALTLQAQGLSRNTVSTATATSAEIKAGEVTLEHVAAVVGLGGAVEAWPCWLRLAAADLDSPVADGLPNRTDAQGAVRTWGQWHDPALSSGPRLNIAGDEALVATNGFGADPDGAAVALLAAAGLTVLSAAEAAALQTDPAWTEGE